MKEIDADMIGGMNKLKRKMKRREKIKIKKTQNLFNSKCRFDSCYKIIINCYFNGARSYCCTTANGVK